MSNRILRSNDENVPASTSKRSMSNSEETSFQKLQQINKKHSLAATGKSKKTTKRIISKKRSSALQFGFIFSNRIV